MRDIHLENTIKKLKENSLSLDETVLESLYDEMLNSKSKLNTILGLNVENDYRIIIDYKISENRFRLIYPKIYRWIKKISNGNLFSITNNTISVGNETWKLSTYISKYMKSPEMDYNCFDKIVSELEGSSDILSRLSEYTKERKLVISTNIYDFFTSSTDSVYTSCYRMQGEFFNGNISYARDNFTLICFIYADDITRKIGRDWAYIFPEELKILLSNRQYGSIYKSDRKEFRTEILKRISNHYDISHNWRVTEVSYSDNDYYNARPKGLNTHSVYFDKASLSLSYHKSRSNNRIIPLEFRDSKCLRCGIITEKNNKGWCGKCADKKCFYCGESKTFQVLGSRTLCEDCYEERTTECTDCGNRIFVEVSTEYDGQIYCSDCFGDSFFYCDDCEEYFPRSREVYIEHSESSICTSCSEDYTECYECGELYGEVTEIDGHYYCEHCVEEHFKYCDNCHTYVTELDEAPNGEYICEDCMEETVSLCTECEEKFYNGDLIDYYGRKVCDDCKDRLEQEELSISVQIEVPITNDSILSERSN